ncbi:MAG TPA: sugar phosphate nucleotidyltransferase [Candidatus Hydrogenedentes bacterium]|nr:sugar phosphate nucleotidyltransferase [Candidatus Hydrogenedentota bacterium]
MPDESRDSAGRTVAVIMAGGVGERFWPLSREKRPKQLLPLSASGKPLLEDTLDRLDGLVPPGNRFLVASISLLEEIRRAIAGLPPDNYLVEPARRNTAGCLAWAAACLLARGFEPEHTVMTALPADAWVSDHAAYRKALGTACAVARAHPAIVVIGIRPTRPETGYGYIEQADSPPVYTGDDGTPVYPVARFREKPNVLTAEEYLASGRHYWNAGIFVWRLDTFLSELEQAGAPHRSAIDRMASALRANDPRTAESVFLELPSISIDFALMEHARSIRVVPGAFHWDDVGEWSALERILPSDAHGNAVHGQPVLIDVTRSVVFQDETAGNMAVALLGVHDLAVVVTGDAVLVLPKSRAQDVRKIVQALRDRGMRQV